MMPNKCSTGYGKWEPWLPPGFRFHPTDEELVTFYLAKKVQSETFEDPAIAEVDLNNSEPWDLPEMAKMGEKEWYFYTLLDKKYPTGMRTNRATRSGYWKATGKDREIMSSRTNSLLGMKKTLVFYKGRAPKGEKTNWVMHEYRLEGNYSSLVRASKGERVVCRVFQKNVEETKIPLERRTCNVNHSSVSLCSLPPLLESPPQSTNSIPFITSVSSHSDFAQPSCMHHDELGESSELTKRSSCLKLNLCSLNSRSSTIFNVAKSLDDNYSYELLNTMPQMTNDGLNSSFRAFLVDNSEAQQMDMKAIFMNTSKIQHNLNSSGFSLEEFLQGYEEPISPADNYYSKQQPQQLQVFTVASSQLSQTGDDTFVALRHVQEMADPNAFDRRLTQGTSSISELESLWPC